MTRCRLTRVVWALLVTGTLTACAAREPASPVADARAPRPGFPSAHHPSSTSPSAEPSQGPLAGGRYSLMNAKLNLPPLPDSGTAGEEPVAIPLNTADPRYAEYFAELKRRIEERWSYPTEASRQGLSGSGELRFVLRKDGSVKSVEILKSSGVRVLDSYIENAIRLAAPFPPVPASVGGDVIPISINFNYRLHR